MDDLMDRLQKDFPARAHALASSSAPESALAELQRLMLTDQAALLRGLALAVLSRRPHTQIAGHFRGQATMWEKEARRLAGG